MFSCDCSCGGGAFACVCVCVGFVRAWGRDTGLDSKKCEAAQVMPLGKTVHLHTTQHSVPTTGQSHPPDVVLVVQRGAGLVLVLLSVPNLPPTASAPINVQ